MKIAVIRNYDKRYDYVAKHAEADGYTLVDRPEEADVVVMPFGISEDGVHITGTDIVLDDYVARLPEHAVIFGHINRQLARPTFNYLLEPGMRYMNGIPTAEGAVTEAMINSPKTIWNSKCLVIGKGHVGEHLAAILKGMGADVTMAARKLEDRMYALASGYKAVSTENIADVIADMDIIFSTAPAKLLGEREMSLINKEALIVEVVAGFQAVDIEMAEKMGLKVVVGRKLPGKYSPDTAGRAIIDAVYRMLREQGILK